MRLSPKASRLGATQERASPLGGTRMCNPPCSRRFREALDEDGLKLRVRNGQPLELRS
jgi:hypothetical protein